MADPAPASTMPDDIDALAATVRENGLSEDSALTHAVKGINAANERLTGLMGGLVDLFKGSKAKDDDEDDDDDAEDDDDDAEDDDDDNDVGFPMSKGASPGLFDDEPGDGPVNATEFLLDMAKANTLILEEIRALRDENDALRENAELLQKSQLHLAKMVEHLGGVVSEGQVQMAKAVLETQGKLAQIPAPAKTPAFQPRLAQPAAAEVVGSDDYIGGDDRAERRLLMKAVNTGVISEFAENLFRTRRRFSEDPNEHRAILARVAALTTKVQA